MYKRQSYNYWNSSEHINTAAGKNYYVNSILFASDTSKVIGPTNGSGQGQTTSPYTLGSAVTGSSLTSLGNLTALFVDGNIRQVVAANSASDSLLGAISGVSNGLQITTDTSNNQNYIFHNGSTVTARVSQEGKLVAGASSGVGYPAKLQAHGAGDCLDLNSTSGAAVIHFYESGSGRFDIKTNNGTSGLTFRDSLNGEDRLVINSDGDLLPGDDNTQDLGASGTRWANVYSADVHLNNTGTGGNEVDGSEGSWTMQEGADDLFLINRITGKKYKFNLTEV